MILRIIMTLLLAILGLTNALVHAQRVTSHIDALAVDFNIAIEDQEFAGISSQHYATIDDLSIRERIDLACFMSYLACKRWLLSCKETIEYYLAFLKNRASNKAVLPAA